MKEQKKENGNELNAKTERGVKEMPQGSGEVGSAELGKFKDVNALLQAYLALEAEFTRRSQRLKTLEKEREKWESGTDGLTEKTDLTEESQSGDSTAAAKRSEGATETETAATPSPSLEKTPAQTEVRGIEGQDGEKTVEEKESILPESNSFRLQEEKTDDDALYSAVLANENVRLKVIGEYLSSIVASGAPIVKGGTGTLAVAAKRAESISSAGEMALKMFKNAKRKA